MRLERLSTLLAVSALVVLPGAASAQDFMLEEAPEPEEPKPDRKSVV